MKITHTFLFFISVLLLGASSKLIAQNDSIVYNERYGLSVGLDLFKITKSIIDDDYTGFEINGDYRLTDYLFIAAELGNDDFTFDETNLVVNSKGSYINEVNFSQNSEKMIQWAS